METISLKKQYVRTDGWRGYEQPINAVCGANNTGSWDDSPAPDHICRAELAQAKKVLRQAKIAYKQTWCRSSNVFCVHGYICVHPENTARAKELIEPLISGTQLLYVC